MPRIRQDNDARYALRASFVDENGDVVQGDTIVIGGNSFWKQNGSALYYNDGDVGIGTDNPSQKLDVAGNIASENIYMEKGGVSAFHQLSGGVYQIGTSSNSKIDVYTNNSFAATIDSSGNVGIGNASPFNKFEVKASPTNPLASAESQLSLRNGNGRATYVTFDNSADLTIYNTAAGDGSGGDTVFHQVTGEAMRIDSAGVVSVNKGTLDLQSDGTSGYTNSRILLNASGSTRGAGVFSHNATSNTEWFYGNPYDSSDSFVINRVTGSAHQESSAATDYSFVTVDNTGNVSVKDGTVKVASRAEGKELTLSQGYNSYLYGSSGSNLYLGAGGNSNHVFIKGNGDSIFNGNVGIGTDTPQSPLQLDKTPPTAFGSPFLSIGHDTYTGSGMYTIAFGYEAVGGSIAPAEIGLVTTSDSNVTKGDLVFATRDDVTNTVPIERVRIDSSGNLLVGVTTAIGGGSEGIELRGDAGYIKTARYSASSVAHWLMYNSNGNVGSVTTSANSALFNSLSDVRLKDNIVDAPAGNIDSIKVRSFDWKSDGEHQEYGFIAQELETVAPYAVSKGETDEDMMSVDYSKLVPMMVKEIQDLKAEVAALKGDAV